jgi:hypothetical protein
VETRNKQKIFAWIPETKRLLGRRWDNNIATTLVHGIILWWDVKRALEIRASLKGSEFVDHLMRYRLVKECCPMAVGFRVCVVAKLLKAHAPTGN